MNDKLVRVSEVRARTGLSLSQLYRLEAQGLFPRRVKIGRRMVAFKESELVAWMRDLTH